MRIFSAPMLALTSFLGIVLFLISYVLLTVPFSDISKLESGYYIKVLGERKDSLGDEFDYHLTKNRPEVWLELDMIASSLQGAVIASEDWSFYQHRGVDWQQLNEAIQDYLNGKRVRGASTITQQVVKNLFLSHDTTFRRKLEEAVISLYIERKLSKERIIEIYLNIAHWGARDEDNFYGAYHAADFYFGKPAAKLSGRESAFLAMLLPSPVRYATSYENRQLTEFARRRMYQIIDSMRILDYIDREQMDIELSSRFSWEQGDELYESYTLDIDLRSSHFLKGPSHKEEGSSYYLFNFN